MKKKIFILAGIACLAFTGCEETNSKQENKEAVPTESVVATEKVDEVSKAADEKCTVMPLPALYTDKASDEMPDGEYSVAMDTESLVDNGDGYQVSLEFFDYDRYTIADMESMKVGDSILVDKEKVEVKSVQQNKDRDGNVMGMSINGGTEEGGIDFLLMEDCYRTTSLDDFPLYYSIGKGTLKIAKDMTLKDCIDYEKLPDGVDSKYEDLPDSITGDHPEYWTQANTTVTVHDGEIVNIVRHWTP